MVEICCSAWLPKWWPGGTGSSAELLSACQVYGECWPQQPFKGLSPSHQVACLSKIIFWKSVSNLFLKGAVQLDLLLFHPSNLPMGHSGPWERVTKISVFSILIQINNYLIILCLIKSYIFIFWICFDSLGHDTPCSQIFELQNLITRRILHQNRKYFNPLSK